MATIKEWVFENVSSAFVSIRTGDRVIGLAPKSVRPVSAFFKKAGGPDVEAARANESVQGLIGQAALKLYEREYTPKIGNTGRVWNEDDPEEVRVQKVLDHRKAVKAALAGKPADKPAADKPAADKPVERAPKGRSESKE